MLEYYSFQCRIKVIETVRPNGILIAQNYTSWRAHICYIIHSSIRRLDLGRCNHENDGMHLNFPSSYKKSGSWFEPGTIEENKGIKSGR
jgi:hypothetical protein